MAARRLRWIGTSQRARQLDGMRGGLDAWLSAWSVPGRALQLDARPLPIAAPTEMRWLAAQSAQGCAWIAMRPDAWARLGARLLDLEPQGAPALAAGIAQRATEALLQTWVANRDKPAIDDAPPGDWLWQARSGASAFALSGEGIEALVVADDALADRWRVPATEQIALSSRQDGVGAADVRLEVVLDLGASSLEEAGALQVGDVLVSDAPLASAFQVRRPDGSPMLQGQLLRVEDRRALLIEPLSTRNH